MPADSIPGLIRWMKRQALAYRDWTRKHGDRYRIQDADRLMEWILDLDLSDVYVDGQIIAALASQVERMRERPYGLEEDRWDDIVDWLYQLPESLRDFAALEKMRAAG